MLGLILAGAVTGALTLVLVKGRQRPQPRTVRVEDKNRRGRRQE